MKGVLKAPIKIEIDKIKTEKIAYADALTLEEIEASTDLTNKVAGASALKNVVGRLGNAYVYSISSGASSTLKLKLDANTTNVFYFGAFNTMCGYMFAHFFKKSDGTVSENDVIIKNKDFDNVFSTATISDDGNYAEIDMKSAWVIGTLISNRPISVTYA